MDREYIGFASLPDQIHRKTIKKGFAIGRDIESMVGDLSRWMSALSDIDQAEKEAKKKANKPKRKLSQKQVKSYQYGTMILFHSIEQYVCWNLIMSLK